jgi:hypothetical protein
LEVRDVKGRNPGAWHGVNDMPRQANALGAAFGDALALDGGLGYVAVPPSSSLDIGTNQVTLSLWVKLFQKPSAMAEDFGSLYDAANDSYVMYLDRSSKELRFKVVDAQGYAARPGIPESRLVMGAWHHVVGVYDGNAGSGFGRTSIYLDGRLADTHIGADGGYGWHMQGIVRPGQSAAMGRNGTDDHGRLACVMDDVALWRRALDGGDVRWIYESGLQGTPLRRLMARLAFEQVVGGWDGSALRLQGQMEYGMTVTNLQFLVSDRVDGAFTPVAGGQVHDLGDNRFEFDVPLAADGAVFYKIVRPLSVWLSSLLWCGIEEECAQGLQRFACALVFACLLQVLDDPIRVLRQQTQDRVGRAGGDIEFWIRQCAAHRHGDPQFRRQLQSFGFLCQPPRGARFDEVQNQCGFLMVKCALPADEGHVQRQ